MCVINLVSLRTALALRGGLVPFAGCCKAAGETDGAERDRSHIDGGGLKCLGTLYSRVTKSDGRVKQTNKQTNKKL